MNRRRHNLYTNRHVSCLKVLGREYTLYQMNSTSYMEVEPNFQLMCFCVYIIYMLVYGCGCRCVFVCPCPRDFTFQGQQQRQQSAITPPDSSMGVCRLEALSVTVCLDVSLCPPPPHIYSLSHREGPAAGDRLLLSACCQPVQHTALYPALISTDFLPFLQT